MAIALHIDILGSFAPRVEGSNPAGGSKESVRCSWAIAEFVDSLREFGRLLERVCGRFQVGERGTGILSGLPGVSPIPRNSVVIFLPSRLRRLGDRSDL
jgi:hypothetical protein